MSGQPDPKPVKRPRKLIRVVDPAAVGRARLTEDECGSCRKPPSNAHHVVPKGAPYFGDDVPENIVMVCGSGTDGCHGALHGSPYVDGRGKRWPEAYVRAQIGITLRHRRPDVIRYVLEKMGDEAGRDYLRRRYYVRSVEPAMMAE